MLWTHVKKLSKSVYALTIGSLILLSVLMASVCLEYYQWLHHTIKEESNSAIQEISSKTSDNLQRIVKDNFSMLDTLEKLLQQMDHPTAKAAEAVIDQQAQNWNYAELLLIDESGQFYDDAGNKIKLEEGKYLQNTIINRQNTISPAQVIAGRECVLFAIPVEQIEINGAEISAIGVTYLVSDFDEVLSITAYDGKAYTHIINRDGTIAVPSQSENASLFGYNVISYLKNIDRKHSSDITEMAENIIEDRSGQIECSLDGADSYIIYHPIDFLDWCLVTVVPVEVANVKTHELLNISMAFCLFIFVLVTILVCFLASSFIRNKKHLEKLAYVDYITGGNTIQYFRMFMAETMKDPAGLEDGYAIVYTNLEKFRIINEQFGRDAGNMILTSIDGLVREQLRRDECIARMADDHFCLFLRYESIEEMIGRFRGWYYGAAEVIAKKNPKLKCPVSQFGIYLISDQKVSLDTMIDRARFALSKLTLSIGDNVHYTVYDEKAHQKILREKYLEDRMESALAQGEFMVYLQPKYLTKQKVIGGAEALVRWRSEEDGMIFPDEFIPLFEKNGFVIRLDLWVFDQTCKKIQEWVDEGRKPVTVSVNCSRVHFNQKDFIGAYQAIYNKYHFPAEYIDIELTESAIYDNMNKLTEAISRMHEIGFSCSIDDFGSGYSSLNMIQNVAADTLKLDKIFFRVNNENDVRGQSVVESILVMAKALSMKTVAEGVEYEYQVEQLQKMNCDYIQGYIFAKPMPMDEFEKMLFLAE